MAEREEGKVGILPKELVGVDCPRCGFRISEDSEISFNREDSFFVGYSLSLARSAAMHSASHSIEPNCR